MNLRLLNQVELISNWGYFQISQYYIKDLLTGSTFPKQFATLKDSALFSQSRGSIFTKEKDVPGHSESSFGRCLWDRVSINLYKSLSYQQLISVLTSSAEELREFGLKPPCDESTLYPLDGEIVPLATKMLPPDAAYYVFEPEESDIGGVGAGIWDYFKNFVVYSTKNLQVFRVDMGVD